MVVLVTTMFTVVMSLVVWAFTSATEHVGVFCVTVVRVPGHALVLVTLYSRALMEVLVVASSMTVVTGMMTCNTSGCGKEARKS